MPLFEKPELPKSLHSVLPADQVMERLNRQIFLADRMLSGDWHQPGRIVEADRWRNETSTLLGMMFHDWEVQRYFDSVVPIEKNDPSNKEQGIKFSVSLLRVKKKVLETIQQTFSASISLEMNSPAVPSGNASSPASPPTAPVLPSGGDPARTVFVVHGHDDGLRYEVLDLLRRLKLRPIVLADEADDGDTIIEKFERIAPTAGFAVVLLTPDDRGGINKDDAPLSPRARQNVVLELGYFIGKLGRKKVRALQKLSVEVPSDYLGVLHIPVKDDWKTKLAKEMQKAGIKLDMNDLVA